MRMSFTILHLTDSPEQWEQAAEKLKVCSGKYVYFASADEIPDQERIRGMLKTASPEAELIVSAAHTQFPADEKLEEPLLLPLHRMFERFRCSPMLNGKLIRKSFLLDCLKTNPHDWIHSPCPDLFLLLFQNAKTAMVRTEYLPDQESFLRFAGQYRQAAGWLSGLSLMQEEKDVLAARILQYEDYLIDLANRLDLSDEEILQYFHCSSIVHNAVTADPGKLPNLKLKKPGTRPGPVRKLGVFCAELRNGGAERCASLMLQHFASLPELEVSLFLSKAPAQGDYSCPENVEIEVLPQDFYARYARLPGLLRQKAIDTCLFFDHFTKNNYYDILTAAEQGIRTIAMEHNTFSFPLHISDTILMPLRQTVYKTVDLVTCLSRSDEYYWNARGIRTRYMPNPLTFDTSARPPFTERTNKNLIFIARLTPLKGVLDALKAVEIVRQKHPDVKLFLLGQFPDPGFEQICRDYVKTHGINDNIIFTGFTNDVGRYCAVSSIHLMPSAVEGYPMTLMEVKSYGVPSVIYSLPYLEAGKEEYGTISVPQRDFPAMAAKVSELLDDFDKLNEIARKAYESLKWFDNSMVFSRWAAVFQWLETGIEPDQLAIPVRSAEEKLTLLQIQADEIISAILSTQSQPSFSNAIMNQELPVYRRNNILFDIMLKLYFGLRQKMENSPRMRASLASLFHLLWLMKRFYRKLKPWQDEEQKL